MTDTGVNAKSIDAFAFARLGKEAQGSVPLARLTRLVDGLPEQPAGEAGLAHWSVRGEVSKSGLLAGQPLLHLHVRANPLVVCQRCNAPFAYPVDSEVVLQLVKSEDELDDGFGSGEHSGGYAGEDEDDDHDEREFHRDSGLLERDGLDHVRDLLERVRRVGPVGGALEL